MIIVTNIRYHLVQCYMCIWIVFLCLHEGSMIESPCLSVLVYVHVSIHPSQKSRLDHNLVVSDRIVMNLIMVYVISRRYLVYKNCDLESKVKVTDSWGFKIPSGP